jgi:hypothetical protein
MIIPGFARSRIQGVAREGAGFEEPSNFFGAKTVPKDICYVGDTFDDAAESWGDLTGSAKWKGVHI